MHVYIYVQTCPLFRMLNKLRMCYTRTPLSVSLTGGVSPRVFEYMIGPFCPLDKKNVVITLLKTPTVVLRS